MKKMIAAIQTSVDGFIEGPNGELDWVEDWSEDFDILDQIDTCVLGAGMYPDYEKYWMSILENPEAALDFTGKKPTEGEIAYAKFADKTPHYVLSTQLEKVAWGTAKIIKDINELKNLKQQSGKNIHVVGGATLISNLMNYGLIDELRLVVNPIVIGGGKALFKDVVGRHKMKLVEAKTSKSGQVIIIYRLSE